MAAMQISDKPLFVRHGYSVPLHELGRNGRMKPRQKASSCRVGSEDDQSSIMKLKRCFGMQHILVYFCPLNHKIVHFTLLGINELEEVIRHYNPMADNRVIDGTMKLTWVGGRLVKVR